MPYVYIDAEEALSDMTDQELRRIIGARAGRASATGNTTELTESQLLDRAYYECRGRIESPALREYFYRVLGKIA